MIKVELTKLSICECGFPVLADHIELGTQYEIDNNQQRDGVLVCGGCNAKIRCQTVWVKGRNGGPPGYLPLEIFGAN